MPWGIWKVEDLPPEECKLIVFTMCCQLPLLDDVRPDPAQRGSIFQNLHTFPIRRVFVGREALRSAILYVRVMAVSVMTMASIRYGAQFIHASGSIWSPADRNLSNGCSFVGFS